MVAGLWYLLPVLLLDMQECIKLDQLGASATLVIPTVFLFVF